MSNMMHLNGLTYFSVPELLVTTSKFSALTGAELKLYTYLAFLCQKNSKVSNFVTAEEFALKAGISRRNLINARAGLDDKALIQFTRGSGGYEYILLHPETGKPLVKSLKGDYAPLDFNKLDSGQLAAYYRHHLRGAVEQTKRGLTSLCPFHDDSTPSLVITLKDSKGSVWFCNGCKAGGRLIEFETKIAAAARETITASEAHRRIRRILVSTGVIEAALGTPTAIYDYADEQGKLLYQCLRYKSPYGGKSFNMRRPDPDKPGHYIWGASGLRPVLFNLPEIVNSKTVVICEGEKDCLNVRSLNLDVAVTTCPYGAQKWRESYSKVLKGKRVVILPDNDDAGARHAKQIEASLIGQASATRICSLPAEFKDVSEYLEEHDSSELVELVGEDWIDRPVVI